MTWLKHNYLSISTTARIVILMGYKLPVTKTEYLILNALMHSKGSPLSADQISNLIGYELSSRCLAFHVFNINSKAKLISNRILIKNIAKMGYFLN